VNHKRLVSPGQIIAERTGAHVLTGAERDRIAEIVDRGPVAENVAKPVDVQAAEIAAGVPLSR
jgi:hypothetical protein